MALLLGDLPGIEQVALDSPGDVRDAGLAGFAGREVAGLLGLAKGGPVWAVADGEAGHEDLEQKRGQGKVHLVREKAATVPAAACRAYGKLIRSGGMPLASAPAWVSRQMAW